MMNRPVHFEILAEDPERVVNFYRNIFGWEIASWEGSEEAYWLATTGPEDAPGINGAFMGPHFDQAVINTIEVESLEQTLAQVDAAGGRKVLGPNEIPGVGTHAYCADPSGILFGVLQPATVDE